MSDDHMAQLQKEALADYEVAALLDVLSASGEFIAWKKVSGRQFPKIEFMGLAEVLEEYMAGLTASNYDIDSGIDHSQEETTRFAIRVPILDITSIAWIANHPFTQPDTFERVPTARVKKVKRDSDLQIGDEYES